MKIRNFLLALLCGLGVETLCGAPLRLPEIISDNMVLQQRSEATLWGWADADRRISVTPSWSKQTVTTRSDADGKWQLSIPTPEASDTPHTLIISDGRERIELHNVLIGEVWFCSGQSNMEMPLGGYWNQPVEGANRDIALSGNYPTIRMATIEKSKASVPQEEVRGKWAVSSPAEAPKFSATAYYCARMMREVLHVPIGIIQCSWGGAMVEGWMPKEMVAEYADIDLRDTTSTKCLDYLRPTVMYNGMLRPLCRYTIRGFLWYQGCSNVSRYASYAERLAAMVDHWRGLWGNPELPFYFVEIAPYDYSPKDEAARLREAQHRAAKMIPHSGVISTADLVYPCERTRIHPTRKREYGERLAYMVLNHTYGYTDIACDSPEYRSMSRAEDGAVILEFDHTDYGFSSQITSYGEPFIGFEAAGADRIFHPAQATLLAGHRIRVALPDGTPVEAVRYGFHDWAPATVWGGRDLPLVPFRTDNWE